jgi:hypothetical protein
VADVNVVIATGESRTSERTVVSSHQHAEASTPDEPDRRDEPPPGGEGTPIKEDA